MDDGTFWPIGNLNISGCINEMNIVLINNNTPLFAVQIGGITGGDSLESTTISNCYNLGDISVVDNSYKSGTGVDIGGIAGISSGKIINCYSSSNIYSTSEGNDYHYGSLVGTIQNSAKILSCYYYDDTYRSIGAAYDSNHALSNPLYNGNFISDYNKSKKDKYSGWDFNSTWTVLKGINDGYPILQWMESFYKVASPYSNMSSGTYTKTFNVELFDNVEGAIIYYTTDGKTPTTSSNKYTSSISITKDTTIKMIAFYKNFAQSEIVTYKYKFACVSPTANYKSGKSFSATTNITLATKEKNATIYYTTNGKTPTTKSTKYTKAIPISADTIIKAITVVTGKSNSEVATFYYYVSAATPTANNSSGTYASTLQIKLSTATKGATIYYTIDGKTPTSKSKKYTGAFTVNKNTEVRAIAINGKVKSSVAKWNYKVKVENPYANKASGRYKDSLSINLSTDTSGATIYYTTDGTTPTVHSLRYTKAIKIYNTTTIKAVAIKDGMVTSSVFNCKYTIY